MNTHSVPVTTMDAQLRERAERVIPNGMWGHQRASSLPQGYPQYFASGKDACVTDVDGNSYIDFMCAWGPIILGHRNPLVDAAALSQIELGDSLNGPTAHAVELAELLVATIPHADWALFQKNGTDATTSCVTIARGTTKRRKVLVAKGAYHGAAPPGAPPRWLASPPRIASTSFIMSITMSKASPQRRAKPVTIWRQSSFRHSSTISPFRRNRQRRNLRKPQGRFAMRQARRSFSMTFAAGSVSTSAEVGAAQVSNRTWPPI